MDMKVSEIWLTTVGIFVDACTPRSHNFHRNWNIMRESEGSNLAGNTVCT